MTTTKRAQVRQILESRIAELPPGAQLPSERSLVAELGVSRVTVRAAIAELVAAGRLESTHGKGTHVVGPKVHSRLHLTSFSREMRARGLRPSTRVLSAEEVPAQSRVAELLEIVPGATVLRLERLRLADDIPMCHEIGFYPTAVFPGLIHEDLATLYDVFDRRYRIETTHGQQEVRAEAADARHAEMLHISRRSPLLVQERVTYSGRTPMEYAISWYRGDRYSLHSSLAPRASSHP